MQKIKTEEEIRKMLKTLEDVIKWAETNTNQNGDGIRFVDTMLSWTNCLDWVLGEREWEQ